MVEILKALLVGLIAGIPVGPILVMVAQRTLCHGRRAGAMVGLGAATGDMLYAAVGLLTLSLVERFVEDHRGLFMLLGGVLIALVGIGMLRRELPVALPPGRKGLSAWTCYLQALGSTLSNPAALALILGLLGVLGVGGEGFDAPAVLLAPAVGAGEALYWLAVVYLLGRFLRLDTRTLGILSRVAGALVCVFALVLMARGIVLTIK
ncbi:MAG: LysE family transporter [Bacteroidales bacterium]|nr:LysE family transporter [Bacteroidales bacterium]